MKEDIAMSDMAANGYGFEGVNGDASTLPKDA